MTREEKRERLLELLVDGRTLTHALAELGMDSRTVWKWRREDPAFDSEVTRAIDAGMDAVADRLIGATERAKRPMTNILTGEPIIDPKTGEPFEVFDRNALFAVKVEGEHARWLLERRARAKFAPSVDVNVAVTVDVRMNLEKARAAVAALPVRYPSPSVIEGEAHLINDAEDSALDESSINKEDDDGYDFGEPASAAEKKGRA